MTKKTAAVATAQDTTGLMAIVNQGQDAIPAFLEKVNAQIAALKGNIGSEPKTTGSLAGFGKIKDIKTVADLIKAHSSVTNRAAAYKASAKVILPTGIKMPPFMLDGSSESAWVADIQARVTIVAHKTQLDKLTKIKEKLESNLSAKAKLAKDLGDIANMLND